MQVGLLCKKTQCLVLSLLLSLSFQASIIDDLRSTYKIINMEDLFARLDTGDKYHNKVGFGSDAASLRN